MNAFEQDAAHPSDLAAHCRALAHAGLARLTKMTPLRITGADRLEFLHGQVSHEVKRLGVGESRVALMLNVRGHALALMRIYRRDDDLYVAVEGGAGEIVKDQLQAHIIFDQVILEPLGDALCGITVQGDAAGAVVTEVLGSLALEPDTFTHVPFASAKVLVSPATRSLAGGYDLHVLRRDAAALEQALVAVGATQVSAEALEAARIEAGLADAEHEGGPGVLPQEAGLEHAVSYRKGCYLGQEIMARIEARGTLRRQLAGLKLSAHPAAGDPTLFFEGKAVGRLGGVAAHPQHGVIALASVRKDLPEGAVLTLGTVRAHVVSLPFA